MVDVGVVVNSGPIIALSSIRQLSLLHVLFSAVHVPAAVQHEVVALGVGRPGCDELKQASWALHATLDPPVDPLLLRELGRGEAEVISFAVRNPGLTAVLDDKRARRIARIAYGIPLIGTTGILVRAKRAGKLVAVKPAIEALQASGYFLSAFLVKEALRAAEE